MKKRHGFFDEIYNECSDIKFILSNYADDEGYESLERRYKIVVMTILPILLSRVRTILFLFCFPAGFFLGMLAAAIFSRLP